MAARINDDQWHDNPIGRESMRSKEGKGGPVELWYLDQAADEPDQFRYAGIVEDYSNTESQLVVKISQDYPSEKAIQALRAIAETLEQHSAALQAAASAPLPF
jgi:hypothetical protein